MLPSGLRQILFRPRRPVRAARASRGVAAWCRAWVFLLSATLAAGATADRRRFDIPADNAERALRQFSAQSGIAVIFPTEVARGVRTHAIKGEFTAREALDLMVRATVLEVRQDAKTGALTVVRKTSPATPDATRKASMSETEARADALRQTSRAPPRPSERFGVVRGRISNAATAVHLEGALVTVRGTTFSTQTQPDGSYELRLPPGDYTLEASYTGLDAKTCAVAVLADATTMQDVALTAEIYAMNPITVSGEREGNALAIHQQRYAPNVKSVLSADAFGNVADENLGNFLLRIPGIGAEILEGEVSYVQVRGVSPDLSAVTIDGTRAPSGGTGSGLTRAFEIDKIPADFIETIEVTKAATADMDADSIGGSINLKTKSALSRRGRSVSLQVGTSYNVDRDSFRPAVSFMYSNTLGKAQNLGLMFTASYHETHKPRDSSNLIWEQTADTHRPLFFWIQNFGDDELEHNRGGAGLRLDYKLNEGSSFHVSAMYSHYDDLLNRKHGGFAANRNVVAFADDAGVPRTAGGLPATILPGWTQSTTETINHTFNFNQNFRVRTVSTWNLQAGGKHRSTALGTFDYNVNFAPSRGTERRTIPLSTVTGVGFRFERANGTDGALASWEQISGPDITVAANRTLPSLNFQDDAKTDAILGAQANWRREIARLPLTYVKVGLRLRRQERERTLGRRFFSYRGPDGVTGVNPATGLNDDDLGRFLDMSYRYRPYRGFYPPLPFLDVAKIEDALRTSPQHFNENRVLGLQQQLRNDVRASEEVYAGYALLGTRLRRLDVNAGIRMEETRVKGSGTVQEVTPEESARRAAWSGPVTEEELLRRTVAEYGNHRTNTGRYRDWFPSVHTRYELTDGVVARVSWSTGIGRPNFDSIIPNDVANHEAQLVTANNAALRPQYANNWDVALEYYFKPAGLLSVGVFKKKVRDFVFTGDGGIIGEGPDNGFAGQFAGYRLRTQFNGGFALIRGLEVSYQQQFSRLPGLWRGLGVFANYTWLESRGDYATGMNITEADLAGFVPRSANAGITYTNHRWAVRVHMHYTSDQLFQFNPSPLLRQYTYARRPVDFSVKYNLSARTSVFVDVINAFRSPIQRRYMYIPGREMGHDWFSPVIKFGVSARL